MTRLRVIVALALLFITACAGSDPAADTAFSATTGTAAGENPEIDLGSGLIGHFPLDGDAIDVTGSTNGELVGAERADDRFGEPGMAVRIGGEGQHVQFPNADALNVAQDFSIAIWIELGSDVGTDWYTLFEKSDPDRGGHSRYGLWLHGGRPAACFEVEDNSQQPCVEADDKVPTDGWHHIAAVRADRRLILYVDGVEVANGFVGLHAVSQTSFNAFIGGDTYQPATPWLDAAVDELRVYARDLNAAEVMMLASH